MGTVLSTAIVEIYSKSSKSLFVAIYTLNCHSDTVYYCFVHIIVQDVDQLLIALNKLLDFKNCIK